MGPYEIVGAAVMRTRCTGSKQSTELLVIHQILILSNTQWLWKARIDPTAQRLRSAHATPYLFTPPVAPFSLTP